MSELYSEAIRIYTEQIKGNVVIDDFYCGLTKGTRAI